ncbi:MAG: hypothetical protein MJK04_13145 [Psychrosphaera sp.]|nr:hypothetical protein [Psychrosphaera sp.]
MKWFTGLLALTLFCTSAVANEDSPWDFAFELGAENDSNVVIEDTDQTSNTDSVNRQLKLALGYKHKTQNKTTLSAHYTYFDKDYQSVDQYDSNIHLLSFKTSHKFDAVKIGIAALFVDSNLNSKDFIQVKQISPSLSYFFNKTNYFHGSLSFGEKDFSHDEDRSASQRGVSMNLYHLFNGLNNYITAGFKFKDESAIESEHSYNMFEYKLSYIYRSQVFDFPSKLNLSYRYQKRIYEEEFNDDIDDFRHDKRHQLSATYRIEWQPRWYSEFDVTHNANQSNLEAADYDQTRFGFLMGYKLK